MKKILIMIALIGTAGVADADSIQNTAEGPHRAMTCNLAISRAKVLAGNLNPGTPIDFGKARCECDKTANGYYSCISFVEVFRR